MRRVLCMDFGTLLMACGTFPVNSHFGIGFEIHSVLVFRYIIRLLAGGQFMAFSSFIGQSTFLTLLTQSPVAAIIFVVSIVLAITIHEFAHAWTADRLGDDTPRLMGRVTLNPLAHLDPIGSVAFILLGFGWGRPVIYNPMRLSHKIDELWIALAGPISNILLAIVLNALAFATRQYNISFFNADVLSFAAQINVFLAAFNMLPIPPLDGSSIIAYFFPTYRSLMGGQIGLIILLLLIFSGILGSFTQPIIHAFNQLATLGGIIG